MNQNYASAAPAENMVLAFFLMVLFIIVSGFTQPEAALVLIPLGFSCSIVQINSGLIQLKNGDIMGGNINLAFSVFTWQACIGTLLKALEIMPADTVYIDGWLYLMMGIYLVAFTPASCKVNLAVSTFMIGADIFFIGNAFGAIFGVASVASISNWGLILCVVSCLWQGIGQVLNTIYGRTVIEFGPALLKIKSEAGIAAK